MGLVVQICQMILMLSILVILHEFGHYLTAKWFKTRVEKFFLFFDWPRAIVKKKIGETVWGIGILPLGGYVKIAGMIDESMDKEQMKQPPQPWEFRSKPAWQRLIIMLGGIVVNVLLAWLILTVMYSTIGHKYESVDKINQEGYAFGEVGKSLGFQDGDKILTVDGKKQVQFKRQVLDILLGRNVEVERNGERKTIVIEDSMKAVIFEQEGKSFIQPRIGYILLDSIQPNSVADLANLQKGDEILAINSTPLSFYDQLSVELKKHASDSINLKVLRNNQEIEVAAKLDETGRLGIYPGLKPQIGNKYLVVTEYSFFEAIPVAIEESIEILKYNIKNIKLIFKPATKAYKSAKSFIGITRIMPTTWDWEFFWNFTAMFSMWLAFLNLLPIPGLDGGHALFTIGEMVTGRKLNDKAMGIVQSIGMIILLALMIS